ncbi:hypothetical protein BKG82_27095 [Mycobacteroides chelonae]|uniref:Uncharacterized protein n=1 Tax=Mycobacteroides chelonae TaxID=1774 RepID=A0A1S1LGB1_MYCCH|nr:hypothetical protein [Mycobacteroides chelonae]OHU47321.1 hypothetical protein BKG82_27095 [Mycobacteroides chelonae]
MNEAEEVPSIEGQLDELRDAVVADGLMLERGLRVRPNFRHLVFCDPGGVEAIAIARQVGEIYSNSGMLDHGNVREVHVSDLLGGNVQETEAKTRAVIAGALGGVLYLRDPYALVSGTANNGFGLVVVNNLLVHMEIDAGRLVVIIAGVFEEIEKFLDHSDGLRPRFDRAIYLSPSKESTRRKERRARIG